MPSADEKPASIKIIEPSTYRKSQPVCQDSTTTPGASAPSGIFLLNFESSHRESLALTLRARRHRVFVPEEHGTSLAQMQNEELRQADYILFDLTRVDYDHVFLELRRICRLRKHDGMPVLVTCVSRIYQGAAFQIIVEQLGARLIYAA